MRVIRHRAVLGLVALSAFLLTLMAIQRLPGRSASSTSRMPKADSVSRNGRVRSGTETLMIFIGDSNCGASKVPGLPSALDRLREAVKVRAATSSGRVVQIGVALDWEPDSGLAFLESFGPFDEVQLGGNWLGQGATRWIWRDSRGAPVLPQLIIVERDVLASERAISISQDRVVARLLGSEKIRDWENTPMKLFRDSASTQR